MNELRIRKARAKAKAAQRCLNCGDRATCLCWSCLRAVIVPLLITEFIHWCFR